MRETDEIQKKKKKKSAIGWEKIKLKNREATKEGPPVETWWGDQEGDAA